MEHRLRSQPPEPAADGGASVLIEQAMQMLGVSRRTVYYWIRQGRLRTMRTRLGSQRVLVDSIRELELVQELALMEPPAVHGEFRS